MTIAEQLKSFYTERVLNEYKGRVDYIVDYIGLASEAEQIGKVTQDWDSESTEYDFVDGSVLVICGPDVTVYGSR